MKKEQDNKATLSFTHWGETISVSKPNSDIKFDEFCEMMETLVRATWGFDYADKFINPDL
jgi:hypothetical protein